MPLTLDKDELLLLDQAMSQAISSAQRQQNMKGKTPQITAIYKQHEQALHALHNKITNYK